MIRTVKPLNPGCSRWRLIMSLEPELRALRRHQIWLEQSSNRVGLTAAEMLTRPDQDEAIKPLSGRKVDRERNDGATAERRSVGRSKLRLVPE